VTVRAEPGAGHFDLGWVWDGAELVVRDAADVGDTWIFGFSYAGVDAGEQTATRAELRDAGWRLEVSPLIAERLAAAGLDPAYRDLGAPAAAAS
jgi:hypothetical protein